jgi:hypothetical protein
MRANNSNGRDETPLPEPTDNLLGDIDLGLENFWVATEMEMNVQLPTCETMEKDRTKRLVHDCTWKNVNVHHWIKVFAPTLQFNAIANMTSDRYANFPERHRK